VNYNFDGWNHIKIIVAGTQGEVYINDMQKPAFRIAEFLRTTKSGSISFSSARADAYIANVSIVKESKPQTLSISSTSRKLSDDQKLTNYVSNWQVSNSFSENELAKTTKLNQQETAEMNWQPLSVDSYGILNLARVQGINKTSNTAFASFSVVSK